MANWSYISPGDSFPKAKAAAQHSLEIDPSSAEAHAALGYIHMYYDWAFADAQTEFKTAIGLNPNLASAHRYYAIYLGAMLRPRRARCPHVLFLLSTGTRGSTVVIGGDSRDEEGELLGHVHPDEVLLLDAGLAVGVGEDDIRDLPSPTEP